MSRATTHQQRLRNNLLRQRETIVNRDHVERDSVHADAEAGRSGVFDEADVAAFDLQADLDLALLEIRSEAIRQIDHALARIDAGTYGICEECGITIAAARLRALPSAERCRDCEEVRESVDCRQPQPFGVLRLAAMPFVGGENRDA